MPTTKVPLESTPLGPTPSGSESSPPPSSPSSTDSYVRLSPVESPLANTSASAVEENMATASGAHDPAPSATHNSDSVPPNVAEDPDPPPNAEEENEEECSDAEEQNFSDASSYGEDPDDLSFDLANLIDLRSADICRSRCTRGGVRAICGKRISDCIRHANLRKTESNRFPPAYYYRAIHPTKGPLGDGRSDARSYTTAQFEELLGQEETTMADDLRSLAEEETSGAEDVDFSGREEPSASSHNPSTRVSFDEGSNTTYRPPASSTEEPVSPTARSSESNRRSDVSDPREPSHSPTRNSHRGGRPSPTFQHRNSLDPEDSDHSSEVESVTPRPREFASGGKQKVKKKTKKDKKEGKKGRKKDRKKGAKAGYRSSNPGSKSKSSSRKWYGMTKSGRKKLAEDKIERNSYLRRGYRHRHTFSSFKEGHRWLGSKHGNHSSSNSSSSEDESSVESSSSSSSSSGFSSSTSSASSSSSSSGNYKPRSKKKTKSKKNGKKPKAIDSFRRDPSVGNPKEIFKLPVAGTDIKTAMAPAGISKKDVKKFFNTAVDVTSFPGEFSLSSSHDDSLNPLESASEMTSRVLTLTGREKGEYQDDKLWAQATRHGLRKLTDPGDTFAVITKYRTRISSALEQQDTVFASIMSRRNFSERKIKEYCETGLLPRIIQSTNEYYLRLLYEIQHLQGQHPHLRSGTDSPARAMLDHHREKLGEIRRNSFDRTHLIFNMYTYLRDAAEVNFMDSKMHRALWNHMAFLQVNIRNINGSDTVDNNGQGAPGAPSGGNPKVNMCKKCSSRALHAIVRR